MYPPLSAIEVPVLMTQYQAASIVSRTTCETNRHARLRSQRDL